MWKSLGLEWYYVAWWSNDMEWDVISSPSEILTGETVASSLRCVMKSKPNSEIRWTAADKFLEVTVTVLDILEKSNQVMIDFSIKESAIREVMTVSSWELWRLIIWNGFKKVA